MINVVVGNYHPAGEKVISFPEKISEAVWLYLGEKHLFFITASVKLTEIFIGLVCGSARVEENSVLNLQRREKKSDDCIRKSVDISCPG